MSVAGLAGLVLGLLTLVWFVGAFKGWYHIDYKHRRGPRGVGEWIVFGLGWLAVIVAIIFLFAQIVK